MKSFLVLFGILDIVTLLTQYYKIHSGLTSASPYFGTVIFGSLPLYLSLILSAYFLIRQRKNGIWISYGQFPLRLLLIVLSFSLFEYNKSLLSASESGYKIFLSIILMLEVVRLMTTIGIHRKHFGQTPISVLTQN